MKEIRLTQGRVAWVDDEDFDILSRWRWQYSKDGYAVHSTHINGRCAKIVMHRFLMNPGPEQIIDHINGNKLDNRRANLRCATRAQNAQNVLKSRGSTMFKGVYAHGSGFQARIEAGGVGKKSETYETAVEAAAAYDRAARMVFGPDAATNERILTSVLEKLKSLK